MNVGQLIQKLSEFPLDHRVRCGHVGEIVRVETVKQRFGEPLVIIRWTKRPSV